MPDVSGMDGSDFCIFGYPTLASRHSWSGRAAGGIFDRLECRCRGASGRKPVRRQHVLRSSLRNPRSRRRSCGPNNRRRRPRSSRRGPRTAAHSPGMQKPSPSRPFIPSAAAPARSDHLCLGRARYRIARRSASPARGRPAFRLTIASAQIHACAAWARHECFCPPRAPSAGLSQRRQSRRPPTPSPSCALPRSGSSGPAQPRDRFARSERPSGRRVSRQTPEALHR